MAWHLIGQPYRRWNSGESFLATALRDERVERLLVISAWTRASGLSLLVPHLQLLRSRRGRSELFTGIDLGTTTRQGLELAQAHVDTVRIVHDPAGGTFHPKAYLAWGRTIAYALVGSNNLTAGGLVSNHEVSLGGIFDPRAEPTVARELQAYADILRSDGGICKRLTAGLLRRLDERRLLGDELRRSREDAPGRPAGRRRAAADLFSRSRADVRRRPAPRAAAPRPLPGRAAATSAAAPDTWWKVIRQGEAQRLPAGHTTARIRLTNVPEGHDKATYFRAVFFATEQWSHPAQEPGVAVIPVDVELGDRAVGRFELSVLYHGPTRVRGRATTDLSIRPLLPLLRATDITGWYAVLERGQGTYRLRFTRARPS